MDNKFNKDELSIQNEEESNVQVVVKEDHQNDSSFIVEEKRKVEASPEVSFSYFLEDKARPDLIVIEKMSSFAKPLFTKGLGTRPLFQDEIFDDFKPKLKPDTSPKDIKLRALKKTSTRVEKEETQKAS